MNHYIILTANIHPIGGMQTYVAGKTKFLEAEGWKVTVFFSGRNNDGGCAIKSLEKYKTGWFPEIAIPPGNWPAFIRKYTLRDMCKQLNDAGNKIVIESQASAYALWGELLAKEIGAKHVCFICNETFRGKDRFYEEYLDFCNFKHVRKELAVGMRPGGGSMMPQLFAGYKTVLPEENYTFRAANEGPVQDVNNEAVDKIQRADWNICYIGRIDKGYVPNVIQEVRNFSAAHPSKKVQFIIVGNQRKRQALFEKIFSIAENVTLTFLGDCVPIPRSLYSKVDVVIAGSDCAVCSAREGALTIVADARNFMANGVLGIDTFDSHYCEPGRPQMRYQEALEKVLVRNEYEGKEISNLPYPQPCEYYYRQQFELIENSEKNVQYYDVVKNKKFSHKLSWAHYRLEWMLKILVRKHSPMGKHHT